MSENLIGATTAVFPIRLSVAVASPVDVEWATRDGSAVAGSDYKATAGTVTFLPGETEKQIEVQVYGQAITPSDDKVFFIRLNPPSNAVLVDAILTCTINIIDDQGIPSVAVVVAEGRRGPKGNPGLSAYEQAVLMGYTGTLAEWMDQIADASKAADRAGDHAVSAAEDALKAQNAAKNAVFAGVVFPTAAEGVDPILGVMNGAYFNVRSPLSKHYIDEYQNVNGVAVATGKSYPTSDHFQDISEHTALPFVLETVYKLNQRVVLSNGDIVKSTIDGNTNDPNSNMSGWVNINLVKYLEDFSGGINIANNSAAITSANSAKSVIYAKGTYKVSSNTTITHNMEIIDSKIQPIAGVVITVGGTVVIDANCEWMDTSLGGTFDFIAGAFERRVSKISTSPTSEYNINQGYPGNQISNQAPGVFVNGGTRSFPHKIGANSGLSVIGGAYDNTIEANAIATTIAGGAHHIVKSGATHSAVLGGSYQTTFGNYSTLGGGTQNKVGSNYSTVGGGQNNIAGDETLASLDDSRSAVVAGGASNSAKGKWSTIAGGGTNTIPNTADSAAISGGQNNTASGVRSSVLGGNNNTASGQASACLGGSANSATTTTAAAGGNGSVASGISSFAYGDYCNATGLQSVATGARCNAYLAGMKAHANGWFAVAGDAQISDLVARRVTTAAAVTRLDLNGGVATPIVLPNNKTWMFVITIAARNTTASEHAAYEIKGCIKRDAAANTTAFIGTPTVTVIAESVAGWDANVSANTTTGALDINVTGEEAKTIRWVARIQLTEVGI